MCTDLSHLRQKAGAIQTMQRAASHEAHRVTVWRVAFGSALGRQ